MSKARKIAVAKTAKTVKTTPTPPIVTALNDFALQAYRLKCSAQVIGAALPANEVSEDSPLTVCVRHQLVDPLDTLRGQIIQLVNSIAG